MLSPATSKFRQALWSRFATLLSFVAVLSALVAPASMLAEEVRTGKLGGVCLVNTATNAAIDANGDATPASAHCDLCGSLAFVLPPFAVQPLPSRPGHYEASADLSVALVHAVRRLPPSRGPPAL